MTRTRWPLLATVFVAAVLANVPARADPPPHAKAWGHASRQADRYDHDRGAYIIVERLPHDHRHMDYRGSRYYYDGRGHWYEPYGAAYVSIAPPLGLVIDSRGIAVVARVPVVRW